MAPSALDALPDADQVEMAAYVVWGHSLCRECGQPLGMVTDPSVTWLVEDDTCYACWSKETVERRLHKEAENHPESLAGRRVYVKGHKPRTGGHEHG